MILVAPRRYRGGLFSRFVLRSHECGTRFLAQRKHSQLDELVVRARSHPLPRGHSGRSRSKVRRHLYGGSAPFTFAVVGWSVLFDAVIQWLGSRRRRHCNLFGASQR